MALLKLSALIATLCMASTTARPADLQQAALRTYISDPSIAVPDIKLQGDVNALQPDDCLFLSPHGGQIPKKHDGVAILQRDGEPIWVSHRWGSVHNFRMQQFQGQPHLAFWSGHYKEGVPRGMIYLLNDSYESVRNISTDPLPDLHEFQVADGGASALVAVKRYTQSALGTTMGTWVMDGCFHELDVNTDQKKFAWCAADHISPDYSFVPKHISGFSLDWSYDFFHLNSVYKDDLGNYLVSGRSMHALYYLDARGQVIWQLGGVENDFTGVGQGDWTFGWQHHASFVPSMSTKEERFISLFDNGTNGLSIIATRWTSRGVILAINERDRTVRLHAEFNAPDALHWDASSSQGSVQVLDDGNVLVGFGKKPFFVVYTPDGHPLLTGEVGSGGESYRTIASKWVGRPNTRPVFSLHGESADATSSLLVSWNGATEVATWQVLGGSAPDRLDRLASEEKKGFETLIGLTYAPEWIQIVALDSEGEELQRSEVTRTQLATPLDLLEADGAVSLQEAQLVQQQGTGLTYLWHALMRWIRRA